METMGEGMLGGSRKVAADGADTATWVEKYRPKAVSEVVAQEEAVQALQQAIADGASQLPHLLFYGPPGTGKTSTALALANELFGPNLVRERVKEMNASDDRGIRTVREKVKKFAQLRVSECPAQGLWQVNKFYHPPPFKLLILDEADALTPDAQAAMRRMMEDFSGATRFILVCNYISKIIDPITSRCAKFRFKPLAAETMKARLVAGKEGVAVSDECVSALHRSSRGDMRAAITYLQMASSLYGSDLRTCDFDEVSGRISQRVVDGLLVAVRSGNYDGMQAAVVEAIRDGHSAGQLVAQVHDAVVESADISSQDKALVLLRMVEYDKRLTDGCDEQIQLLNMCSTILHILCKTN